MVTNNVTVYQFEVGLDDWMDWIDDGLDWIWMIG